MTAKTSISLTDDQQAYARSLVESGQYPSLSVRCCGAIVRCERRNAWLRDR